MRAQSRWQSQSKCNEISEKEERVWSVKRRPEESGIEARLTNWSTGECQLLSACMHVEFIWNYQLICLLWFAVFVHFSSTGFEYCITWTQVYLVSHIFGATRGMNLQIILKPIRRYTHPIVFWFSDIPLSSHTAECINGGNFNWWVFADLRRYPIVEVKS